MSLDDFKADLLQQVVPFRTASLGARTAEKRLRLIERLGGGTYGDVYKAVDEDEENSSDTERDEKPPSASSFSSRIGAGQQHGVSGGGATREKKTEEEDQEDAADENRDAFKKRKKKEKDKGEDPEETEEAKKKTEARERHEERDRESGDSSTSSGSSSSGGGGSASTSSGRADRKYYAVKYYKDETRTVMEEGVSCTTLRELSAVASCGHHPNVVRMDFLFVDALPRLARAVNQQRLQWLQRQRASLTPSQFHQLQQQVHKEEFKSNQNFVFAAYEFCAGGDLKKLLTLKRQEAEEANETPHETGTGAPPPLNWGLPLQQTKRLAFQLLNGLAFLHSGNLCHRDLKPDNLMLTTGDAGTAVLKIGDLGLCRELRSTVGDITPTVCTIYYRPLEVLLGRMRPSNAREQLLYGSPETGLAAHYGLGADLWSAGCIIAEMIRGIPLFKGTQEFEVLIRVTKVLGTPTEEEWTGCCKLQHYPFKNRAESHFFTEHDKRQNLNAVLQGKLDLDGLDLLARMLDYNPHRRITAAEALSHPWFTDVSYQQLDGVGVYNWYLDVLKFRLGEKTFEAMEEHSPMTLKTSRLSHVLCQKNYCGSLVYRINRVFREIGGFQDKEKVDYWKAVLEAEEHPAGRKRRRSISSSSRSTAGRNNGSSPSSSSSSLCSLASSVSSATSSFSSSSESATFLRQKHQDPTPSPRPLPTKGGDSANTSTGAGGGGGGGGRVVPDFLRDFTWQRAELGAAAGGGGGESSSSLSSSSPVFEEENIRPKGGGDGREGLVTSLSSSSSTVRGGCSTGSVLKTLAGGGLESCMSLATALVGRRGRSSHMKGKGSGSADGREGKGGEDDQLVSSSFFTEGGRLATAGGGGGGGYQQYNPRASSSSQQTAGPSLQALQPPNRPFTAAETKTAAAAALVLSSSIPSVLFGGGGGGGPSSSGGGGGGGMCSTSAFLEQLHAAKAFLQQRKSERRERSRRQHPPPHSYSSGRTGLLVSTSKGGALGGGGREGRGGQGGGGGGGDSTGKKSNSRSRGGGGEEEKEAGPEGCRGLRRQSGVGKDVPFGLESREEEVDEGGVGGGAGPERREREDGDDDAVVACPEETAEAKAPSLAVSKEDSPLLPMSSSLLDPGLDIDLTCHQSLPPPCRHRSARLLLSPPPPPASASSSSASSSSRPSPLSSLSLPGSSSAALGGASGEEGERESSSRKQAHLRHAVSEPTRGEDDGDGRGSEGRKSRASSPSATDSSSCLLSQESPESPARKETSPRGVTARPVSQDERHAAAPRSLLPSSQTDSLSSTAATNGGSGSSSRAAPPVSRSSSGCSADEAVQQERTASVTGGLLEEEKEEEEEEEEETRVKKKKRIVSKIFTRHICTSSTRAPEEGTSTSTRTAAPANSFSCSSGARGRVRSNLPGFSSSSPSPPPLGEGAVGSVPSRAAEEGGSVEEIDGGACLKGRKEIQSLASRQPREDDPETEDKERTCLAQRGIERTNSVREGQALQYLRMRTRSRTECEGDRLSLRPTRVEGSTLSTSCRNSSEVATLRDNPPGTDTASAEGGRTDAVVLVGLSSSSSSLSSSSFSSSRSRYGEPERLLSQSASTLESHRDLCRPRLGGSGGSSSSQQQSGQKPLPLGPSACSASGRSAGSREESRRCRTQETPPPSLLLSSSLRAVSAGPRPCPSLPQESGGGTNNEGASPLSSPSSFPAASAQVVSDTTCGEASASSLSFSSSLLSDRGKPRTTDPSCSHVDLLRPVVEKHSSPLSLVDSSSRSKANPLPLSDQVVSTEVSTGDNEATSEGLSSSSPSLFSSPAVALLCCSDVSPDFPKQESLITAGEEACGDSDNSQGTRGKRRRRRRRSDVSEAGESSPASSVQSSDFRVEPPGVRTLGSSLVMRRAVDRRPHPMKSAASPSEAKEDEGSRVLSTAALEARRGRRSENRKCSASQVEEEEEEEEGGRGKISRGAPVSLLPRQVRRGAERRHLQMFDGEAKKESRLDSGLLQPEKVVEMQTEEDSEEDLPQGGSGGRGRRGGRDAAGAIWQHSAGNHARSEGASGEQCRTETEGAYPSSCLLPVHEEKEKRGGGVSAMEEDPGGGQEEEETSEDSVEVRRGSFSRGRTSRAANQEQGDGDVCLKMQTPSIAYVVGVSKKNRPDRLAGVF